MRSKGTDLRGSRVHVAVQVHPAQWRARLIEDVRTGLARSPKSLPPKYFYDARGSRLFEEITLLEEYYPTRAETAILERHAGEFLAAVRPSELVEIGSGSSKKTQLLLRALRAVGGDTYVPLDVSADALEAALRRLSAEFPWLSIRGLVGDFDHGLPPMLGGLTGPAGGRRLLCFLGSTIGNFEEDERLAFLRDVHRVLQSEDGFLLGVDLIKDKRVLEAAYDDARGVTAEFNKNVLRVLNRELEGDFDEDAFRHVAFFDERRARIEMHLEARRAMRVRLAAIDLDIGFESRERLRTEISCKFDRSRIERDCAASGLAIELWRTDPQGRFALLLARRS